MEQLGTPESWGQQHPGTAWPEEVDGQHQHEFIEKNKYTKKQQIPGYNIQIFQGIPELRMTVGSQNYWETS